MSNLFFLLLIADVALYAAAQLRGYEWADQACANVSGLCDQPLWLGAAAMAFFLGAYFTGRRR